MHQSSIHNNSAPSQIPSHSQINIASCIPSSPPLP
jgi:hypothetical protein